MTFRRRFEFEAARLGDFADHVHESFRALRENERNMYTGDRRVVAGVDFSAGFVEREFLHEHTADAGKLDFACRCDGDLNLQAAERAGAAIDRVQQVFQPGVHGNRRDGDRRHAEIFFVLFFEFVAELGDRQSRGTHLAEQRERDRAIGLHDEIPRKVVVGLLGVGAGGGACRAATGGEGLDAEAIADLDLVRARDFFACAAVVDGDDIALADAILGHLGRAGVADVFTLRELLPGDHAAGVPADLAAAAAGRAINAPNRIRSCEIDRPAWLG